MLPDLGGNEVCSHVGGEGGKGLTSDAVLMVVYSHGAARLVGFDIT